MDKKPKIPSYNFSTDIGADLEEEQEFDKMVQEKREKDLKELKNPKADEEVKHESENTDQIENKKKQNSLMKTSRKNTGEEETEGKNSREKTQEPNSTAPRKTERKKKKSSKTDEYYESIEEEKSKLKKRNEKNIQEEEIEKLLPKQNHHLGTAVLLMLIIGLAAVWHFTPQENNIESPTISEKNSDANELNSEILDEKIDSLPEEIVETKLVEEKQKILKELLNKGIEDSLRNE